MNSSSALHSPKQSSQAKPVMESKSYDFVHDLMTDVVERKLSGPRHSAGAASKFKSLPKNITMPPKEQLIQKRMERTTTSV